MSVWSFHYIIKTPVAHISVIARRCQTVWEFSAVFLSPFTVLSVYCHRRGDLCEVYSGQNEGSVISCHRPASISSLDWWQGRLIQQIICEYKVQIPARVFYHLRSCGNNGLVSNKFNLYKVSSKIPKVIHKERHIIAGMANVSIHNYFTGLFYDTEKFIFYFLKWR